MPRRLLQDILPAKRTSRKATAKPRVEESAKPQVTDNQPPKAKYKLWLVAFVSVMFFLFSLSYLFTSTTITISPKIENLTLNENLSANRDATGDGLSFDLVVISGEESKTVETTTTEEIVEKARGIALIYNTYSSAPQTLDVDTRLEGSNGKIYKTEKRIVVPGMDSDGTPGNVEVVIYASEAGEEYNSAPLDFKIVGFKGTSKYSKFYGRSNGDIKGGLNGTFSIVSDDQKVNVGKELGDILRAKLLKKATDQIPSGFILFRDAIFLDIVGNDLDPTPPPAKTQLLTLKGTLYGFLLNEDELTKKIITENLNQETLDEVYIQNIRDLKFSLAPSDTLSFPDPLLFKDAEDINFNLSGEAEVVSMIDTEKLTNDLLGKSKKDFTRILSQYPGIEQADLETSPFWVRSIASDVKDLEIIVNYPK